MLLHITHIGRENTTSNDINGAGASSHALPILRRLLSEIIMPEGFDHTRGWHPFVPAEGAKHFLLIDSVAARQDRLHDFKTAALTAIPSNFGGTIGQVEALQDLQVPAADIHRVLLIEDRSTFGFRSRWDRKLKNWLAAQAKDLGDGQMTVIVYPRERPLLGNSGVSEITPDDGVSIRGVTIVRASQSIFEPSAAMKAGMVDPSVELIGQTRAGNADTLFADVTLPPNPLPPTTYSVTDVFTTPMQIAVARHIATVAGLYDIAASHDQRPSATIHRLGDGKRRFDA